MQNHQKILSSPLAQIKKKKKIIGFQVKYGAASVTLEIYVLLTPMLSIIHELQTGKRQASCGAHWTFSRKQYRRATVRQVLTACLIYIRFHWQSTISRKSVSGVLLPSTG